SCCAPPFSPRTRCCSWPTWWSWSTTHPARIIPAWADFALPLLEEGRTLRGIGEPIWVGCSGDELAECAWHQSLVNTAFAGAADDAVLVVHEAVVNTVLHAGGVGRLRTWTDGRGFLCEVRDGGRIDDPLAGRRRPSMDRAGGRGLWLIHQLCDLVQIRRVG